MKIQDLSGKKVCILGFGKEGKAMVAALEKFAPGCEITIADENSETQNIKHKLQVGKDWLKDLHSFDVLIKSPGIPHAKIEAAGYELFEFGEKLTSSTHIFLDTIADRGAITIGVTGTKGKSTTASLIYAILKAAGKDVILIGNIGEPAIAHLDDVKKDTVVIMEMSSYQLSGIETSPHIAVVTSFFPDHLDYHGDLEQYMEAKKNITMHQESGDMVFFNYESQGAMQIAREGRGRKIPFSYEDSPIDVEQTNLIGLHNQGNMGGACMVAAEFGIGSDITIPVLKEFKGLPHRLQSLGIHHGIEWIDDAISTTPESTIAGIRALNGKVRTIILGGQDRGYDFTELAREVMLERVTTVILFPGSGPRIRETLEKAGYDGQLFEAASMEEAVTLAKAHTKQETFPEPVENMPEPVVLLSTASPSYNMFKNFEEKGEEFKRCIMV
jgi:UDP-N-acetylmuramoyl-L-alanine---L-glutamate ligase